MGKYKLTDILNEQTFKDIFSPQTMGTISKKSAAAFRELMQMPPADMRGLLDDIKQAEAPYRSELEALAKQIVEVTFPVLEKAGIKIDATLSDSPDFEIPKQRDEEEPEAQDIEKMSQKSGVDKRRIINAVTQGASLRGAKIYLLFQEYLDDVNPELLSKYEDFFTRDFGKWDDPRFVAMLMAALANNQEAAQGGESDVTWNEEEDEMTIKAVADTFPILLHEIIKGLYQFVSLQGFSDVAKGEGEAIVKQADKFEYEPEDMAVGRYIYDGLRDLVIDYADNPDQVRELFFAEVYKLEPSWFKIFIENVINDSLTSDQKSWVENTIKDLENPDEETEEDGDQPVGVS